jgi:hypothetical protein
MDSDKPFQYQFFLLKFIGYQHHNVQGWRGLLVECWGYCVWLCLGIGVVTGFHCFFSNLNNVTVFTQAIPYTLNWTMCFVRVTVFHLKKERIKKLLDDLLNATKTGPNFYQTSRPNF